MHHREVSVTLTGSVVVLACCYPPNHHHHHHYTVAKSHPVGHVAAAVLIPHARTLHRGKSVALCSGYTTACTATFKRKHQRASGIPADALHAGGLM